MAFPPGLLGECLLFVPPSAGLLSPEGASAIATRSGRLSTAPRHLRPPEALSTDRRGACRDSRRRPTSQAVAAWGSSIPAALARRVPSDSPRLGSTREKPRQYVLPARPGAVIVHDMISKPCCPSPPVTGGLQLPLFPSAPFLACDLACLVCTAHIKVVSI